MSNNTLAAVVNGTAAFVNATVAAQNTTLNPASGQKLTTAQKDNNQMPKWALGTVLALPIVFVVGVAGAYAYDGIQGCRDNCAEQAPRGDNNA